MLYQQAEQRNGEDAQQGGEESAVGGQFLAVVVYFRQVQQDAGAGGAGQDQDAALEHRIKRKGQHQQVAEEREHQQFAGGDQPGQLRGEEGFEIHGGQPDTEDDHAKRGGHGFPGC